MLNRYLGQDPAALQRLQGMDGKCIGFVIEHTPFKFSFQINQDTVQVSDGIAENNNAVIYTSPIALLRMADSDESELLFRGQIRIEGDTDAGHRFKQILSSVDIDWEEQLSRYTGDILAHRIGGLLQHGRHWLRDSRARFDSNLSDYLREEINLLPGQDEVEQFLAEVDKLRSDVDRLQARLQRLQQQREHQE